MNTGKTLFAQLMDFLPWSAFARIVSRYGGDRAVCSHHPQTAEPGGLALHNFAGGFGVSIRKNPLADSIFAGELQLRY
jgi:hypothetical protein